MMYGQSFVIKIYVYYLYNDYNNIINRFQLEVELDGIYDAIQVLSLTASSSAVIGDPKATTQALTKDG